MMNPASSPPALDSLSTLVLVDQFLTDPDLPPIQHSREFAIYEIISQIISTELSSRRLRFGLSPPIAEEEKTDCARAIRDDGRQDSKELLSWSLLYYCYVRVDLDISLEEFSNLINLTPRSVRRYRNHAIQRLTDQLIRAEWKARVERRRQRLYAQLPTADRSIQLLGREEEMQAVRDTIAANPAATLFFTGPMGIGKTVFVQELLRGYIDEGQLDHLIWIENPTTVSQVYDQLHAALPVRNSPITLREWMAVYRLAVVINDAQQVVRSPQEFDNLLRFLDPALVFIASSVHIPVSRVDAHILLKELDEAATQQLISTVLHTRHGEYVSQNMVDTVRGIAGGNPLAILLTVHNVVVGDTQLDTDVLDRLLSHAYARLQLGEKQAWLCLALCPPGEIHEADVVRLWPRLVYSYHFSSLIRQHLIEVVSTQPRKYRLFTVAHNYIASLYTRSSECLNLVDGLVFSIQEHILDAPDFALAVMAYATGLDWLRIEVSLKRRWVSILLRSSLELWAHPAGYTLLANTLSDHAADFSDEVRITYGIALRQLSRWPDAERVFRQVIAYAGKAGHFLLQARARVEWAIVQRYTGNYEHSIANLGQAERVAKRYGDDRLQDLIALEKAQLAVDMQDGRLALRYLTGVPTPRQGSARYLTLMGEACLLAGDFEQCQDAVQQAAEKVRDDRLALGKLHDLMGRAYLVVDEYDKARHRFSIAVACFSAVEDPFALARCLSNLGAALLKLGQNAEVEEKLAQAHRIQSRLGDRPGLAVTERNIELCRSRETSETWLGNQTPTR